MTSPFSQTQGPCSREGSVRAGGWPVPAAKPLHREMGSRRQGGAEPVARAPAAPAPPPAGWGSPPVAGPRQGRCRETVCWLRSRSGARRALWWREAASPSCLRPWVAPNQGGGAGWRSPSPRQPGGPPRAERERSALGSEVQHPDLHRRRQHRWQVALQVRAPRRSFLLNLRVLELL